MMGRWRWVLVGVISLVVGACSGVDGDGESGEEGWSTYEGCLSCHRSPSLEAPGKLQFGRLSVGESQTKRVVVENTGDAPLEIFGTEIIEQGEDEHREFLVGEGWPKSATLQPGGSLSFEVTYRPLDHRPDAGTIVLRSNDPDHQDGGTRIGLLAEPVDSRLEEEEEQANGEEKRRPTSPCLGLNYRDEIGFGSTSTGSVATRTVTIENCRPRAAQDLEIYDISLVDDAGGVFGIRRDSLPGELNEKKHVVDGEQRSRFVITFRPPKYRPFEGKLKIESNASPGGERLVTLRGEGEHVDCPTALAEASVEGRERSKTTLHTLPLETVVFDGSGSVDPDGAIDRYEWSVIERPADSTARLTPNANAQKPTLFLDLAGTYRVELVVYDTNGRSSCRQRAIVTIHAVPQEDVHVQLVWETPGDPDQTDTTGADLDLHYLNPKAPNWNESPYDIFWGNKTADWGQENVKNDDPSLDIDDTDGAGPENVNHNNPVSGQGYTVGVYYYDDHGFGPSYATVRIYLDGRLTKEFEKKRMSGTFDFWKVGIINWPGMAIYRRDRMYDGFPQ